MANAPIQKLGFFESKIPSMMWALYHAYLCMCWHAVWEFSGKFNLVSITKQFLYTIPSNWLLNGTHSWAKTWPLQKQNIIKTKGKKSRQFFILNKLYIMKEFYFAVYFTLEANIINIHAFCWCVIFLPTCSNHLFFFFSFLLWNDNEKHQIKQCFRLLIVCCYSCSIFVVKLQEVGPQKC